MDNINTANCTSDQIRKLLRLALEEKAEREQRGSADRLAGVSIRHRSAAEVLAKILSGSASLAELSSLRKEIGVGLGPKSTAAQRADVGRLYHLANAAALADHGVLMSRRQPNEVRAILEDLHENFFDEPDIENLVRRALSKIGDESGASASSVVSLEFQWRQFAVLAVPTLGAVISAPTILAQLPIWKAVIAVLTLCWLLALAWWQWYKTDQLRTRAESVEEQLWRKI